MVQTTVLVSDALWLAYVVYGIAILYTLFRFATTVRKLKLEQWIFIVGVILFFFAVISDFFFFSFDFDLVAAELTGIGSLIFAICQAASIFIATMKEVEQTKMKEQELIIDKAALERVNHLKTEIMRTVSHEMRTPLAVMMGFAKLSAEDIRKKDHLHETAANLDAIADEARRMTILIEELSTPILVQDIYKRQARDFG